MPFGCSSLAHVSSVEAEHLQREMLGRGIELALPRRRTGLLRRDEATRPAAQAAERAQEEIANDEDDDPAEAEAAHHQRDQAAEPAPAKAAATKTHPAAAGVVREIAAFRFIAEPHAYLPNQTPNASSARPVANWAARP